ncbi:MAG: DUF1893 domain-containing protein [Lachnospiraceae bacterium]|nr:DUF1893 domain-containing protein [Lachnospiraceae bacterium]
MNKDILNRTIERLNEKDLSCIVMDIKGNIKFEEKGIGIKPLMTHLRLDKHAFKDLCIIDTVVGKAAALMSILGEAVYVHGIVMSETAMKILDEKGIPYSYDNKVPFIHNRTETGMCPMEETVKDIDDPSLAFMCLEETIKRLMSGKTR